jgi:hypothetical protein
VGECGRDAWLRDVGSSVQGSSDGLWIDLVLNFRFNFQEQPNYKFELNFQ